MPTSVEFRKENTVLFAAHILHQKHEDVIDVHHDGKGPDIYSPSLAQIKAYAKQQDTEVLRGKDLPQTIYIADQGAEKNIRPLDILVNEEAPLTDKQFAIDTKNDEFIIFEPRQHTPEEIAAEREARYLREGDGH